MRPFLMLPAILALAMAGPVQAVPVVGSFTADVIQINGDDVAAAPFFALGDPVTGSFGYDTDAATDADPDPLRGLYNFTDTAFLSIVVRGATYAVDPALSPISVSLSIFPGNQNFRIGGGLVPQGDVPLAFADVPLELTLVNGLVDPPFQPTDALPTSSFSLATFSDPNGFIGSAASTPYLVFFQLRTLSIATVPEPASGALLVLAAGAIARVRRKARPALTRDVSPRLRRE